MDKIFRNAGCLLAILMPLGLGWAHASFAQATAPAVEKRPELTYRQALAAALAHSTEVKRANLQVESAQLDRRLSDYDDDPKLGLQATLGTQRPKPSATGSFREQVYGAALTYTLFDFGRTSSKRDQLDLTITAKDLAAEETKDSFVWMVARTYSSVIAAARLEKATREQLELANRKLGEQERNYRNGLRPQTDVVTALVERGRVALTNRKAQEDLRIAKVQLCVLMGCQEANINETFSVPEKSLDGKQPHTYVQLASGWERVPVTTTEKRWQAERNATAAQREAIDASGRPTVDLSVDVQQGGLFNDGMNDLKSLTTGQVQLNWDIPWNGLRRAEYEQVALREKDIDLQTDAYRQNLKDKESLALAMLATLKEQWELQDQQLVLLKRQEALIKQSYEAGKVSALDLNNAEADLMNLEVEQIQLINSSISAAIDIAEARGVTQLDELF